MFVTRIASAETTPSSLGEDPLLEVEHLGDRFDDKIAAGEVAEVCRPTDARRDRGGLVGGHAPGRHQLLDGAADVVQPVLDPRVVEVTHDDGDPEPLGEEQRELGCHESRADDADLGHGPSEVLRRCADRLLAGVDGLEGVDRRPHLVAHDEVGEGVVLRGEGGHRGGVSRVGQEVECPVRGRS